MTNKWLIEKVTDLDDEAFIDVVDAITEKSAVVDTNLKDTLIPIAEHSENVDEAIKNWGKFNGLSTGWSSVDELTYGWLDGELIIMGGEPGVGKSAFICNLAVNLAKGGVLTTIVSLELSRTQVQIRIAKAYGEQWREDIGQMILIQEEQLIRRRDFAGIIENASNGGSKVVIVDYLQMLKDDTDNEHREISRIVKELKLLALKHEITIIAISSLNRGRDVKEGLQMKDLHGSGTIEYYADQVIFLEKTDNRGYINVKIVKNRSNPLDFQNNIRTLTFNGSVFGDDWTKST